MQAVIQILKVNELKTGTSAKTGKPYEVQDAECVLLDENGMPDQIGVLPVPKALRDQVRPGVFTGTFALKPDFQSRRIEAVLTGLTPVPIKSAVPTVGRPASPAAAA